MLLLLFESSFLKHLFSPSSRIRTILVHGGANLLAKLGLGQVERTKQHVLFLRTLRISPERQHIFHVIHR